MALNTIYMPTTLKFLSLVYNSLPNSRLIHPTDDLISLLECVIRYLKCNTSKTEFQLILQNPLHLQSFQS